MADTKISVGPLLYNKDAMYWYEVHNGWPISITVNDIILIIEDIKLKRYWLRTPDDLLPMFKAVATALKDIAPEEKVKSWVPATEPLTCIYRSMSGGAFINVRDPNDLIPQTSNVKKRGQATVVITHLRGVKPNTQPTMIDLTVTAWTPST